MLRAVSRMDYKVSVIVPVYNTEDYIDRCVKSLLEQSLQELEIIIVDDCSNDNSIDYLRKLIEKYPERRPHVKIIGHEVNLGLPSARNSGLKESTGQYVIFCDSDDWVNTTMYEEMYNLAIKEDADIVACNMWIDRENTRKEDKYSYSYEDKFTLKNMYLLNGVYSSLCNKLVKKTLYTDWNIEPLDGVFMWEDFSVSFRLRFNSNKTLILPKSHYHYMINNGQSMSNFSEQKIKDQLFCANYFESYLKKHAGGDFESYHMAVSYVKFMSKLGYFANKKTLDLVKWKTVFPESNSSIFKYKRIPLLRRVLFFFALHGFPNISSWVYRYAQKIMRG